MTTTSTPAPPFKTKKAVREAMTVGSRWARSVVGGTGEEQVGVIVRASSTSRWIVWDGAPAASPEWLPVGSSDARWWEVREDGFLDGELQWRLVAPAPADVDLEALAQLARRRNSRAGECVECGGGVAPLEGLLIDRVRREDYPYGAGAVYSTYWVVMHRECERAAA